MKCKVCGYEFDSGRANCPMCGSKIPEETRLAEDAEMLWNTYDFPKPRKPEDIEMNWPGMGVRSDGSFAGMKKDASEGFVRSASPAREEPVRERKDEPMPDFWASPHSQQEPPAAQPAAPQEPVSRPQPQVQQSVPPQPAFPQGAWQMPQMQAEPSWTPYNVQPVQPTVQMPPISPVYVPTSFTQQYAAQYSQPQTAWTIPSTPQPGQQVFVTQPAQPVYIQPAQPPVYPAVMPAPQQPAQAVTPPAAQPQPEAQQPQTPQPAQPETPKPAPQADASPAPKAAPTEPEKPAGQSVEETVAPPAEPPREDPLTLEAELPEMDEDGRYPERFFTFNKKNEEFQNLLDREYERLRSLHDSDEDFSRAAHLSQDPFRPSPAQEFFHGTFDPDVSEFERMIMESTRDTEGDATLAISRERIKGAALTAEELIDPLPLGTEATRIVGDAVPKNAEAETEEKKAESEQAAQPAPPAEDVQPKSAEEQESAAEPEIPLSKEEQARLEHRKRMEAMARAREAYFASLRTMTAEMRAVKEAEFKAQIAEEARLPHEAVTRAAVPAAVPEKTPEQLAQEKAEEERLAAEKERAEREAALEQARAEVEAARQAQAEEAARREAEQAARNEAQQAAETAAFAQPSVESDAPQQDAAAQVAQTADQAEAKPQDAPEADFDGDSLFPLPDKPVTDEKEVQGGEDEDAAPVRDKSDIFDEILDDVEEEKQRKEEREKRHWFRKFFLVFLLLILAAEGGTVALRHFAPESSVSIFATGIEQNVIQAVQNGGERVMAVFRKDEEQPDDNPNLPQSDGQPFVLSEIIASNNKNISEVVENLGIGYDPQRSYDVAGLSESQLVTDGAEKTSVCSTLIGYNSSWPGYVSGESQECLDFLKADGAAYRGAVAFDKVGQITEQFLKLEIGEIRKTGDNYYAFAAETIEVTEGETVTRSVNNVIYELVPVGDALKIRDYHTLEL